MNLESATILVIDDEPANVRVLERILSKAGCASVASTTDPQRALALFVEAEPDLVLLDLHMPVLDGFAVLARVRELMPADSYLPVLVLTADATAETKRRALGAGANDFLTKPFDQVEVLLRIHNLLESRFLHRELQREKLALEEKVRERTRELVDTQKQVIQQERLRALGTMASGVAHDFNNALSVILGFGELALCQHEAGDYPELPESMRAIITAAGDAARMVDRLKEFHRADSQDEVRLPVDVNALLLQAVSLTQPKWKNQACAQGVNIRVETDLEPVAAIPADPAELREALTNLIFNAVDAMPAGGKITLRSRAEPGGVLIEIRDTGTGMSEEVRQRCFEPFFTTKGEKGTGLGLAMVYGIVERHGGTMAVESALDAGTSFLLRFPPSTSDVATDRDTSSPARLQPLVILLVDDQPLLSELMAEHLRRDGHDVESCTSGAESLRKLRSRAFDIVVTDHVMPGMNGPELARRVHECAPATGIILLTGYTDEAADVPDVVDMVLSKPVPLTSLRQALARIRQKRGPWSG